LLGKVSIEITTTEHCSWIYQENMLVPLNKEW